MNPLHYIRIPFSAWRRIPEQVRRLGIVFLILIPGLILVRNALVPDDFGRHGHYRASAVEEIASLDTHYAGFEMCGMCHDEKAALKSSGHHRNVSCEVCHGPAAAHIEDPGAVELRMPRGRGYCPLCHEFLPSRPTGFPQILAASHNPMKPCISCHDPHRPEPPRTPRECSACHATIARTKSLSHHVYVPCTRCHNTPEEHKVDPRSVRPSKPRDRSFCGGCHADEAAASEGIPQVNLASHGERYVCWQCHYPHLPEAP
jgi:ribosomal protein S27AE